MTPKVVLLAHTPTPEQTVAAAARLCYSDTDVEALRESISQERAEQFVEMLDGFGHESPVEHVTFTFGIEGVSRSFLAQVTRHRIASYSVQSQRYVRQDPFVYITPPAIAADPALLADYQNVMQQAIDSYNRLRRKVRAGISGAGTAGKDRPHQGGEKGHRGCTLCAPQRL